MGRISRIEGEHGVYHVELSPAREKSFELSKSVETKRPGQVVTTSEIRKRGIDALFVERGGDEEKQGDASAAALETGAELWFDDPEMAESFVRRNFPRIKWILAPAGIAATIPAIKKIKRGEKLSRREFLLAGGAAAGALLSTAAIARWIAKKRREAKRPIAAYNRTEHIATNLEYIARRLRGEFETRYKKENPFKSKFGIPEWTPTIGAALNDAHKGIGQLIENSDARERVMKHVNRNNDLGVMLRIRVDLAKKKGTATEEHLLHIFSPAKEPE
ncbi:MAG TPA: hypothetical protein VGQ00_00495 [Candidatus Norongarragalinales archaeon]|nr:hypothetical protein [Candidatus Norongarragalinales archaeon]